MARFLPCVSIQQPYSWLVCHQMEYSHGKTIENRVYPPIYLGRQYSGPILIHAGKKPAEECWDPLARRFDLDYVTVNGQAVKPLLPAHFPQRSYIQPAGATFEEKSSGWSPDHAGLGGIVGIAWLLGVRAPGSTSDSFWYLPEQYGWRLRNARPLPFFACPGQRRIFPVDIEPLLAYYGQLADRGLWTGPLLEDI